MVDTSTPNKIFLTKKPLSKKKRVDAFVLSDSGFFVGKNPKGNWLYVLFKKFNGKKKRNS